MAAPAPQAAARTPGMAAPAPQAAARTPETAASAPAAAVPAPETVTLPGTHTETILRQTLPGEPVLREALPAEQGETPIPPPELVYRELEAELPAHEEGETVSLPRREGRSTVTPQQQSSRQPDTRPGAAAAGRPPTQAAGSATWEKDTAPGRGPAGPGQPRPAAPAARVTEAPGIAARGGDTPRGSDIAHISPREAETISVRVMLLRLSSCRAAAFTTCRP